MFGHWFSLQLTAVCESWVCSSVGTMLPQHTHWKWFQAPPKLNTVLYSYRPSTWKALEGGSVVQSQSHLHNMFEGHLGYMRPCMKKENENDMCWAGEVAKRVKHLSYMPDNLNSMFRTHRQWKEQNNSTASPSNLPTHCWHACTYINTWINNRTTF